MTVETGLAGLRRLHRGKVRDTYDLGDRLLMVASDRISVFDTVLPTPIPEKGRVLTGLSAWWFRYLADIVPNHFLDDGRAGWPAELRPYAAQLDGRAMLVRRAERLPYECAVRGYLAGTGWEEYRERGTLAGEPLERGLREGDPLNAPAFTPARKNDRGHDENISQETLHREVGTDLAERLRDASVRLYRAAANYLADRAIILADTKFEFGWVGGRLTLIDEALTPDSSRLWLAEEYEPGRAQPSLDKQPVRDWAAASGWDRVSPPPELPPEVVAATRERYREAYRRITGEELRT